MGYAEVKKHVADQCERHRARTDRHRRACPFGDKPGLHTAELTQAPAGQTVKTRNAAAKSFFHTQLNRGVEQRLEQRAQGTDRDQKTEGEPGVSTDSKRK